MTDRMCPKCGNPMRGWGRKTGEYDAGLYCIPCESDAAKLAAATPPEATGEGADITDAIKFILSPYEGPLTPEQRQQQVDSVLSRVRALADERDGLRYWSRWTSAGQTPAPVAQAGEQKEKHNDQTTETDAERIGVVQGVLQQRPELVQREPGEVEGVQQLHAAGRSRADAGRGAIIGEEGKESPPQEIASPASDADRVIELVQQYERAGDEHMGNFPEFLAVADTINRQLRTLAPALARRVKELEGALEPFAKFGDGFNHGRPDHEEVSRCAKPGSGGAVIDKVITLGDCRRARSALAASRAKDGRP